MIEALILSSFALSAADQHRESEASLAETRSMVHRYGKCVLKKQQKRASAAIRANIGNAELMEKYPQLIDGQCMPYRIGETVKVSFPGDYFRYALADALFATELAGLPAPDFEPVPLLDHRVPTAPPSVDKKGRPLSERAHQEAMAGYERARVVSYLSRYGECVVRTNPAAARALLLTEPESAQEQEQFSAMSSALGTCVAEGETIKLNKMSLRGTIAINYYRLASGTQRSGAGART